MLLQPLKAGTVTVQSTFCVNYGYSGQCGNSPTFSTEGTISVVLPDSLVNVTDCVKTLKLP